MRTHKHRQRKPNEVADGNNPDASQIASLRVGPPL